MGATAFRHVCIMHFARCAEQFEIQLASRRDASIIVDKFVRCVKLSEVQLALWREKDYIGLEIAIWKCETMFFSNWWDFINTYYQSRI